MRRQRGFTVVEVVVAILVLTVGLVGLVTTAALVTRMVARGQWGFVAAQFAARRLELLHLSGCASQAAGEETLVRGGAPVDSLAWRFVNLGNDHWQVVLHTTYRTGPGHWRSDSLATGISCRF